MSSILTYLDEFSGSKLVARIYSDLLNPLFVPPLLLGILGWQLQISQEELAWMSGLALLFYTGIPLAITLYFVRTGFTASFDLPEQGKRGRIYLYSLISSSVGSLLLVFYYIRLHPFLAFSAIIFFFNPLVGYFLNLRWKVSVHAAALATGGTLLFIHFYITSLHEPNLTGVFSLITLLLLLPAMMWARYRLGVHTLSEVLGGAVAGLSLTLIELLILTQL